MKCKNLRIRTEKGHKYGHCKLHDKRVSVFCNECPIDIKYDTSQSNNRQIKKPIKGKKHNLTKATDIPKKVKMIVWDRDNHQCIFCDKPVPWQLANSHFIKRSQLGLGIEQNIMTNCLECHEEFEKEAKTGWMHEKAREYFRKCYGDWDVKSLIYSKDK